MLIYGPKVIVLQRDADPNKPCVIDFASVSASEPSRVTAKLNDEIVEDAYVGTFSPHTWWSNNPLLGRQEMKPEDKLTIEVGPHAIFRIEHNLIPL